VEEAEKPDAPGSWGMARTRFTRAHAEGLAGDGLVTVSLAGSLFFTVTVASARPRVALYLVLTMAPFVVVAPLVGPAVDRVLRGRRVLLAATALGRGALALLMARDRHRLLLYPEAFGVLVLGKASAVVRNAVVPALVRAGGSLVETNARLARVGLLAGTAAGLVGAGAVRVVDARASLVLAAAAYLVAAATALRVPLPRARAQEGEATADRGAVAPANVALAGTAMGVVRGAGGFLTFLLAFSLKRSHAPSWFDGLVLGGAAVGALLGTLAAPRLRRHVREEAMVLSGLGALALAALAAGLARGRWPLVAVGLVVGVATGGGRLAFDSIVQRDAPELARGRLFARYETRFQLAWVLGALIPVVVPIGATPGLAALGIVLLVLTGSAAAALRRAPPADRVRTERA